MNDLQEGHDVVAKRKAGRIPRLLRKRGRLRREKGAVKRSFGSALLWLVGFQVAGLLASPAFAEGESGRFVLVEMGTRDYVSMEHAGKTLTVGTVSGAATVVESSGGPFVADEIYSGSCFVKLTKSDAGIDLEAPCTFTDPSGDAWYALAIRRAGDVEVGGGGRGVQEIVGGTGKYAGVTGSCTYMSSYVPVDQVVSHVTCEWQKP